MRCFRCFGTGHTRQKCTEAVDRSGLCFRCGRSDNKVAQCTAEPHCPICAEAKRPAAHIAGGKSCLPPAKKAKASAKTPEAPEKSLPQAAREGMDTT
jgi:hypothetical protein